MDLPLVSIVVAAYRAVHLEEALNGLKNQTYQNIEVIILDDCAPEETFKICQRFDQEYENFTHIRNEINIHMFCNFQKALHLGSGKYFMAAADDDFLEPTMIEKCVQELEADPTIASCISEVRVLNADGSEFDYWGTHRLENITYNMPHSFIQMCAQNVLSMGFHGVMRREIIEKILPLPESHKHFDTITLIEMSLYGGIKVIPHHLYNKRSNESSSSVLLTQDQVRDLPLNTFLSQLHYFCPNTHQLTLLYQRIAQSFYGVEDRKALLHIFTMQYVPRIIESVTVECDRLCDYLEEGLPALEQETSQIVSSYFINNAIRTITDLIHIYPQSQRAKQILVLLTSKYLVQTNG
jgi:glycosyltransferase involved in cell wall biosynthesis